MSKPTKALIIPAGGGGSLRFHGLLSEDHEASSVVTKYPSQTGFEVSNHAIRKNRKIRLDGIVTNTPLTGQDTPSSNKSREWHADIGKLVAGRITCKVLTNLGVYEPVVWVSYKTKQDQTYSNAMRVVLVGEEVMTSRSSAGDSPPDLYMEDLEPDDRAATLDRMEKAGIPSSRGVKLKKSSDLADGEFSVVPSGGRRTTFKKSSYDKSKGQATLKVFDQPDPVYHKPSDTTVTPKGLLESQYGVRKFHDEGVPVGSTAISDTTGEPQLIRSSGGVRVVVEVVGQPGLDTSGGPIDDAINGWDRGDRGQGYQVYTLEDGK